jgi:dCTP deaminase
MNNSDLKEMVIKAVFDVLSTMGKAHTLGRNDILDRLNRKDKTKIVVTPLLSSTQIQPASIDVRLGTEFLVINVGKITHLDPLKNPEDLKLEIDKYTEKYKILNKNECFILHPGEFVLGCTLEYVSLPLDIGARLEGRSSGGRLGLIVHSTAGFIDPGFSGNITFEFKNLGKFPISLYPGTRVAQLSFFSVNNDVGYEGKYNESFGVVSSKYFEDYEFNRIRKNCHDDLKN